MKKTIIILLFLISCTAQKIESTSLAEVSSTKRIKEVAKEFLTDIGAEEIILSNRVKGYYFNPKTFQKKQHGAYKKWRPLFARPKNCKLADMFQINYHATDLLSLFSLPKTHSVKSDSLSALCLPSFSLPFELDPKWILTYLAKGIHVFAINYELEEKTTPSEWESTCRNALFASEWLTSRIEGKMIILGKALGSIPASYVAANTKGSSLILENALTLHPLTNKEWLKQVDGKILVIESLTSQTILHLPKAATLMPVTGSHFGSFWGGQNPTWYENEKDQIKLLKFLNNLDR